MDIINLVENLSEDMYIRLRHAAETGRWPEGTKVDEEQKQSAMQIVMAYQAKKLLSDQMMTVGPDGQIVNKTKRELREQFTPKTSTNSIASDNTDTSGDNNSNNNDIARFSNL